MARALHRGAGVEVLGIGVCVCVRACYSGARNLRSLGSLPNRGHLLVAPDLGKRGQGAFGGPRGNSSAEAAAGPGGVGKYAVRRAELPSAGLRGAPLGRPGDTVDVLFGGPRSFQGRTVTRMWSGRRPGEGPGWGGRLT